MFVEERQQIILDQLQLEGKVLVRDLSEKFQVTPDLIRKDLAALEKRGTLKRTYGGAVPVQGIALSVQRRKASEKELSIRKRIAARAEALIQEGDMVFLDISSISVEIAKLLLMNNRRVTVVTNMIEILNILQAESRISLIFLGGKMNQTRDGFTGAVTIEWMTKYWFNLAFIGVVGIDIPNDVVTTLEIDDALTKTCALKVSRKSYLLAESTKFSRVGNCQSAALSDFSGIITDDKIDEKTLQILINKKLDIQIA